MDNSTTSSTTVPALTTTAAAKLTSTTVPALTTTAAATLASTESPLTTLLTTETSSVTETPTVVSIFTNITSSTFTALINSTTAASTTTSTYFTSSAAMSTTPVNTSRANLTEAERMEYLEFLDAEKWPYIYPVIIYLLIFMVVGIVGNSLVIAVYYAKFKPSTTRLFIMTLAICDLLTCCVSVPGVIVEMRYHYTFVFPGLCKVFRFIRMYLVTMSVFTLIIVAVDRFRKVCRPLKPQYTIRSAGFSILAVNIVCLCLSSLGAVVGGNQTVPTDREDVTGSNCSYDDDFLGKPITKFYSAVIFLAFIVCVVLLIVLYCLIGRQVWRHRRFNFKSTKVENSSTDSQNLTASTELQDKSPKNAHKLVAMTSSYTSSVGTSRDSTYSVSNNRNSSAGSKDKQMKSKQKVKSKSASGVKKISTNKTTFTLFIITVVFIVSFLPFLIMVALWGSNWEYVNGLKGYTFTVFKLFFHSYHINNVANCYVYGFCNPRFRDELKAMLSFRRLKR